MNARWIRLSVPFLLAGTLLLPACAGEVAETGEESAEIPSRVETHWTTQFEWFVEHPLLVVGEEASFAAHLTILDGFRPVESGRLTVYLLNEDGSVRQQLDAEAPARSGIFVPTLTPAQPGAARLRLVYQGPAGEMEEVDWTVEVAAGRDQLPTAPPEVQGISFLKEQQWRIPFSAVAVQRHTLRETLDLPATVEPHPQRVADVATPAAGILLPPASGLPTPGTGVRRGDVLAVVSPPLDSATGWHTVQAELTEAQNRLIHAEHEFARASRLVEAGAVPARRLEVATRERETAKAYYESARKRAEVLQGFGDPASEESGGLAALPLRAPIDGTIAAVRVTAGEPVDHNRILFRIVDLNRLVVRVEVPETVLERLLRHSHEGNQLAAMVRPPGNGGTSDTAGSDVWLTAGSLLELGTEVDPESRTAPLRYLLDNRAAMLRPGMAVVTRIQVGEERAVLAVPETAVLDVEGVPVVYVQVSGETFEERIVETGLRDGGFIEIRSGIVAGEHVVTRGSYQVRLAGLSPDAAPAAHTH